MAPARASKGRRGGEVLSCFKRHMWGDESCWLVVSTNPSEKICVKLDHETKDRSENNKYLKFHHLGRWSFLFLNINGVQPPSKVEGEITPSSYLFIFGHFVEATNVTPFITSRGPPCKTSKSHQKIAAKGEGKNWLLVLGRVTKTHCFTGGVKVSPKTNMKPLKS